MLPQEAGSFGTREVMMKIYSRGEDVGALWIVTTMSLQKASETVVQRAQVTAVAIGAPAPNELNLPELAFSYSEFVPLGRSAYWMVLSIPRACFSPLLAFLFANPPYKYPCR